jgi:hypothetical protein
MDQEGTTGTIEFNGDARQQAGYRLMLACAALGSLHKMTEDSQRVFESLEPLVKDKATFMLYRATSLAMGGEAEVAIALMSARLAENPDDDMSKVALGVAMLLVDHPDWRFNIDNVLATSMDQAARQAAIRTITYVPAMLNQRRGIRASIRPS